MSAIENFELVSHEFIHEYESDFYLYSHKQTKARILFIENDDENKVFNISFRTPVTNSKGIPHILEHSVLNGSKNYPLKEPFVNLIKSSMNTFLNAMTYPDRTCYPVASTNKQDLYNLSKVYLDAVFKPILDKKVFQQEGWHYELDANQKQLNIKGVVYNEMKGGLF
ncbi:MAG: hypothetical protein HC932_03320 [Thermales bacterium]|nr:hypothetical protein [Thermales bacterium]